MKRINIFVLAALVSMIAVLSISGCGSKRDDKGGADAKAGSHKKISVVTTIFPQYDWTREILGNKAGDMDLTLLLKNNVDLHSFQPSVDDIVKISESDLFIYVGGESDEWVEDALKKATNPNMAVINLLEILGDGAKTEDTVEGMEGNVPDDHAHKHRNQQADKNKQSGKDGDGDEDDEDEYDEHVWLSLRNAQTFCAAIAKALSSLDSANATEYQNNLSAYIQKLSALDDEYKAATSAASLNTLLFGDRFPFRYLVDDYALKYYAAFPGCSAETEASFKTIVFLAKTADRLNLHSVMVTESADQSIAKTIINNTKNKNQQILVLNSIQSVTQNDTKSGATYLSIMRDNLDVLKQALK